MKRTPRTALCLARQPILDRDNTIVAYELLFRNSGDTEANFTDGSLATAQVINNLLSNFGTEMLVGDKQAFINFDSHMLLSDMIDLLPKDKVVIEILETVKVTDKIVAKVKQLVDSGYTLALDDFVDHTEFAPLLPLANIMKIDISNLTQQELLSHVTLGKKHGMQLLAERVETLAEYNNCLELGFTLFQGFYFAKPANIEQHEIPTENLSIVKIMNAVMQGYHVNEIAKQIAESSNIRSKLLRYMVSSSLDNTLNENDLPRALTILGSSALYKWLTLLLFSSGKLPNHTTPALFTTAISRGTLMEALAREAGHLDTNEYFILGMFSLLDVLLGTDYEHLFSQIVVPDTIKQALLNNTGPFVPFLKIAVALENDNMTEIDHYADEINLSSEAILNAQIASLQSQKIFQE